MIVVWFKITALLGDVVVTWLDNNGERLYDTCISYDPVNTPSSPIVDTP